MSVSLESIVARLIKQVENRFYGKYRGLVVDNADPEQLGRLKVRVPSVLGEEVVSGWAMPCTPYGGAADQGFLFIPEIGAGVWVEFEEGDLEFPIWTGTFWSKPGGESELPRVNGTVQSPPTQKIIKTKSGHTIQLEDAEEEEMITIRHTDDSFISFDKNGSILIGNKNGSTIVLNAKDGNLVFVEEHGNTISMTEDGVVIVDSSGGAAVELAGDMTRVAAKDIILQGSSVTLGADAMFPTLVIDPALQTQLNLFFSAHTHATAMGPSGPPLPPNIVPPLAPGSGLTSAVVVK
ncbi:MAG: hypothetical protein KDE19_04890 [Caldilineaceae bacterium]|nr:hypothetical protein [Caldilineaceae bacterium]